MTQVKERPCGPEGTFNWTGEEQTDDSPFEQSCSVSRFVARVIWSFAAEATADIFPAVDPMADRTSDLVRRLRAFAVPLFEDHAELRFDAPDDAVLDQIVLAPDQRRHWLLLVKEALTNAAAAAAPRLSVTARCCSRSTLGPTR